MAVWLYFFQIILLASNILEPAAVHYSQVNPTIHVA